MEKISGGVTHFRFTYKNLNHDLKCLNTVPPLTKLQSKGTNKTPTLTLFYHDLEHRAHCFDKEAISLKLIYRLLSMGLYNIWSTAWQSCWQSCNLVHFCEHITTSTERLFSQWLNASLSRRQSATEFSATRPPSLSTSPYCMWRCDSPVRNQVAKLKETRPKRDRRCAKVTNNATAVSNSRKSVCEERLPFCSLRRPCGSDFLLRHIDESTARALPDGCVAAWCAV